MIAAFNSGDIIYVRSLRNSKTGILNVECRSIAVASAVKSTFASLVKSTNPPAYLKNVSNLFYVPIIFKMIECVDFIF